MNVYDLFRYANRPQAQTHPGRLQVIGKLAGMEPPPIATCRVLELGTSEGVNIIPWAAQWPQAQFAGVDLAAEPILRGQEFIRECGLSNVHLEVMNLLDISRDYGQFDYILAHGLYAWTPPIVRDKILAIIRDCLSPQGIGFVSYNTQPAGHIRKMVREMLLFHCGHLEDPIEKLTAARTLLTALAKEKPEIDAYDAVLVAHARDLLTRSDSALFHDDMGELYEPVTISSFAANAGLHGLQYLGDTGLIDDGHALPPEAVQTAQEFAKGDRIRTLQYYDFFRMRRFRQSLVCHQNIALNLNPPASALVGLYACSLAQEVSEGTFSVPGAVRLSTNHPVPLAYLRRLMSIYPENEAISEADAPVALQLLKAGAIEVHSFPALAKRAGEKPRSGALVQRQARRNDPFVTTLWHQPLDIDEKVRQFVLLLDGTRDRQQLAQDMQCAPEVIDRELASASRHALLIS